MPRRKGDATASFDLPGVSKCRTTTDGQTCSCVASVARTGSRPQPDARRREVRRRTVSRWELFLPSKAAAVCERAAVEAAHVPSKNAVLAPRLLPSGAQDQPFGAPAA